ncbi:hypothetical protein TREVI0001_1482 [Treponema vincentii ATCC 35580]|uniref:Uncharacterized protein n=1 Tax=Treponema vincentii ATCC 35580 TaxID=596324 RepID=C8PMY0_9SPIR|nr:hypothetical protein TREVI0001_1482 [Treponema vincentii ATCC 35580]
MAAKQFCRRAIKNDAAPCLLSRFVKFIRNFLYFCRVGKYVQDIVFLNNGIALRKDDFSSPYD